MKKTNSFKRKLTKFVLSIFFINIIFANQSFADSRVFYLDLKKGCYSYTKNGKGYYPIETSNYKRLYKSTCRASHHFEVIWKGKIKTSSSKNAPTEAEVSRTCDFHYENVMGYSAPSEIISDTPYLRWFYADPGAETKKYGSTVVCLIHLADDTYTNFLPVKGSLIGY